MTFSSSKETIKLQEFLEAQNLPKESLTLLPRDASTRYYYRISEKNLLVMVADASQKPEAFQKISNLLNQIGLKAPKVLASKPEDHLYLIEDFGEYTFRRALEDYPPHILYEAATDVLLHLAHEIKICPEGLMTYTPQLFLEELAVFLEWFCPQSMHGREAFLTLWKNYFKDLSCCPHTLVLRDFHIDNLFYFPKAKDLHRVGIIDFQDGLFGPVGYDLVSLLYDARRNVPGLIQKEMTERFLRSFLKEERALLKDSMKIMDLSRQLRILGVFSRLAKRDGKRHYLAHMPRLFGYIKLHLQDPFFHAFQKWCVHYGAFNTL